MEASNWQTRLLFDRMKATEESARRWRSLATDHDLDTAVGMIVAAVVFEIEESLRKPWAADFRRMSLQPV